MLNGLPISEYFSDGCQLHRKTPVNSGMNGSRLRVNFEIFVLVLVLFIKMNHRRDKNKKVHKQKHRETCVNNCINVGYLHITYRQVALKSEL